MFDKNKIFLIGFMGSGKTTMGKRLANLMGFDFVDLDHIIAENEQKSIPEIFESIGENGFRDIEHQTLQTYHFKSNCVISCGGGTPCFFDNMSIINKLGVSVYLQTPIKTLAQRLEKGKESRPLLSQLTENEILTYITQKLEERNFFYEQAQIHINTLKQDAKELKNILKTM